MLNGFTAGGAASMLLMVFVVPESYWLGSLLMITSNVCFGMTQVLYYAYLPVLLEAIPDYPDRSPPPRHALSFLSVFPRVWERLEDLPASSKASDRCAASSISSSLKCQR